MTLAGLSSEPRSRGGQRTIFVAAAVVDQRGALVVHFDIVISLFKITGSAADPVFGRARAGTARDD